MENEQDFSSTEAMEGKAEESEAYKIACADSMYTIRQSIDNILYTNISIDK